MEVMMRILRYLKCSQEKCLPFSKDNHLHINDYTKIDWAVDATNRKSILSYFTFVGDNLVSWKSKRQKVITLSSTETEIRG